MFIRKIKHIQTQYKSSQFKNNNKNRHSISKNKKNESYINNNQQYHLKSRKSNSKKDQLLNFNIYSKNKCERIIIDPYQKTLAIFNHIYNCIYIVQVVRVFDLVLQYIKNNKSKSQQHQTKYTKQNNQNCQFSYSMLNPLKASFQINFQDSKYIHSIYFSEKFKHQIKKQFQYLAVCFSQMNKQFIQVFDILNGFQHKFIKLYIFQDPIIHVDFFKKFQFEKNQQKDTFKKSSFKYKNQYKSNSKSKIQYYNFQQKSHQYKSCSKFSKTKKDQVFMYVSFYDGKLLQIDMQSGRQQWIENKMLLLLRQKQKKQKKQKQKLKQHQSYKVLQIYQTKKFNLSYQIKNINQNQILQKQKNIKLQNNSQQYQSQEQINQSTILFPDQRILISSDQQFFDFSRSLQQFQILSKLQRRKFKDHNQCYKNLLTYSLSPGKEFLIFRNINIHSSFKKNVTLDQDLSNSFYEIYGMVWSQKPQYNIVLSPPISKKREKYLENENKKRNKKLYEAQVGFQLNLKLLKRSFRKPFINPFQYKGLRLIAYTNSQYSQKENIYQIIQQDGFFQNENLIKNSNLSSLNDDSYKQQFEKKYQIKSSITIEELSFEQQPIMINHFKSKSKSKLQKSRQYQQQKEINLYDIISSQSSSYNQQDQLKQKRILKMINDKSKVITQINNLKNQIKDIIWIGPLHLLFTDSHENVFVIFLTSDILQKYLKKSKSWKAQDNSKMDDENYQQ